MHGGKTGLFFKEHAEMRRRLTGKVGNLMERERSLQILFHKMDGAFYGHIIIGFCAPASPIRANIFDGTEEVKESRAAVFHIIQAVSIRKNGNHLLEQLNPILNA